jgi:drug/metabolite transporter (DMT)-like permease
MTDHDSKRPRDLVAIAQLLCGATLISFSPVFVKLANVGPTAAGFYRTLFGGAFLLVVVLVRRDALWRGMRPLGLALACGALFAADLSFWHRSIHYIGPGLATIMGNFQIFFLAAFGMLVFRERVDWRFLVSLPLAIVGLFLLVGIDWEQLQTGYKLGVLFGLLTAVVYAAYMLVLQESQSRPVRLGAAANLAWISLLTAMFMAVEVPLFGESFRIPDTRSWVSLLAYGVLCQAMGWIVISRALPRIEASRAGLILLLQPTLAFIWDVLFFSRPTGGLDVFGALLTLAAIYLGGSRRRKTGARGSQA